MSLKCQLCGKEVFYDRKVCHNCEETAIKSGLNSQDGKNEKKWRCDSFLEVKGLAFGSNLKQNSKLTSKMIECPECGEEYSYGRNILHICEHNSMPFGKLISPDWKARKWNCNTAMAYMDLLTSELKKVAEITHLEKLEKNFEWNNLTSIGFNDIQLDDRKIKYLRFE